MKKLICFSLALILVFSFCGCGGKKGKSEDVIDLEYYINLGQMPEAKFSLGAKADDVLASAPKTEEGIASEMGERTAIDIDNIRYYYTTAKKDKGIDYIVSFNGGYGFSQGDVKSEIQKTLSKADLNAKSEPLNEKELFFFPVSGDFDGIKYSFGENTACFVFDNDQLCAVALYKE